MAYPQNWEDKRNSYFGSNRCFYSGISIASSGSSWTWVGISGDNTGFGSEGAEELSQRFAIAPSGTSQAQWSWNNGASVGGEVYGGQRVAFDGVNRSGVWVRSEKDTQLVQIWFW